MNLEGRICFINDKGIQGQPAGAASAIIAYGKENLRVLEECKDMGYLVSLR